MTSRFRTYCLANNRPAPCQGGGTAGLNLSAAAAPVFTSFIFTAILLLALIVTSSPARAAPPVGTVISNTAAAAYTDGPSSGPVLRSSNTVPITTVALRTPAIIEFLKYAPLWPGAVPVNTVAAAYRTGSDPAASFVPLLPPLPGGFTTPIDLSKPVLLAPAPLFHGGEPVFILVTDMDQNLDPARAETVLITITSDTTGDLEVVRLTETGPDTGVFSGYIQSSAGSSAALYNGILTIQTSSRLKAVYTDSSDSSDSVNTSAMVDPYGIIFNSATGKPLDGVTITLIEAVSGRPATVFGDDGVSAFPATITSGGSALDLSGRPYKFPPGGFRFPFVNPGVYQFQVTPVAGFAGPSNVTDAVLQSLPGGPFALVTPGSRLEKFSINPGPAIHIDIPLDPRSSSLWLQKSAARDIVAAGDFLLYQLELQNIDPLVAASSIVITDSLPPGFRYQPGSTRLNGAAAPDPAISPDGRTLVFTLSSLNPKAVAYIRYVVEIAAAVRPGVATNLALARSGGGAVSNPASASVQVRPVFMNSRSFILGEVRAGPCGAPFAAESAGIGGVRILLEDGTFAVTDKNGRYHFEGVNPGSHVVQMDLFSLPEKYELLLCEKNSRFAGTAYSQFVDLQGGTLWRADFHLGLKPAASGAAELELRSVLNNAADNKVSSDTVIYSVPIRISAVPVRNLRLTILLPDGLAYQAGTGSLNGIPLPEPANRDNSVTFELGDRPLNWAGTVRFTALIPFATTSGELPARAMLTFDTPLKQNERSPVVDNILARKRIEEHLQAPDIVIRPHFAVLSAELSAADQTMLDSRIEELKPLDLKHITVIGHTDSDLIIGRGRQKFSDNYVLSQARARTVGLYIAAGLQLAPEQVTYLGKGADEPIASNETLEGRALNRRVKLVIQTDNLKVTSELSNRKERSGVKSVATQGLRPGEQWLDTASEKKSARDMPEYSTAWLDTVAPGAAWLWPPEGFNPPIPSLKLAVLQEPGKSLKLLLNGAELDPLYLDGTVKRQDNSVAITIWRGVHILEGDNLFEAVQYDADGKETARLPRVIHYSRPPVKAATVLGKSRLVADGKNPPIIAIRLMDRDGHPAREGVIGEYALDPPYLPQQQDNELKKTLLTATDRLKYRVGEDGIALIELQPTTRTGEAVIRFNLVSGEQEARAWLRPDLRDWILVGLAEGTAGYNVISKNMVSAGEAGLKEGYEKDGRVAFYAKGSIKGEWLLTIAYDSAKSSGNNGTSSLFQTIDPNSYYSLYGDNSQQLYDAASARKLYLKIERDQFYALFGDFNTGLTYTELSRYSRSLNGFKTEYQGKVAEFKLFGAETGQAFVKDELRGDGTSGLYRLSRRNLVINSEKITIEVRDRFRSEIVIESRTLSRFLDYSIDFDNGTLFFKAPLRSRDENFNPVYIVVDYEVSDGGAESLTYGGRVGVKLLEGKLRTGVSHLHEGQGTGQGNLYGLDALYTVDPRTNLKVEAARTDTAFSGAAREGNAFLAELQHDAPQLQGKLFFRQQEEGFGLGQQKGSEAGTRKLGGEAAYKLTDLIALNGQTYRQYNLATGGIQDLAEAKTVATSGPYSAHLGLRYANDRLSDGTDKTSEQLTLGGSWLTLNKRLTLRADRDQAIGGNSAADFPTRTTLGADFKLTEKVTLLGRQEFTSGVGADTSTTSVGLNATPWEGGAVNSSLGQNLNENGDRVFALFGLKQILKISDKWSVDGGLDRSQTIRKPGNYQFNVNVPPASGESQDFTAVSLGTSYKEEKWYWSTRLEFRTSPTEDKRGLLTAFINEPKEGWGWSARWQTFDTREADGSGKVNGDLRLGLVYRPLFTRWIILDRLDLLYDREQRSTAVTVPPAGSMAADLENRRIVNNLNANFKPDSETQLSLQYGVKYVQETIDGTDYCGFTDLAAIEGRYDLTSDWDIGLRGSVLHTWNSGQFSYSAGPSVGYSIVKNAWLSLGYNLIGFIDKDFSAANYTAQGPFIRFRFKFDQNSVRDAVNWINHE